MLKRFACGLLLGAGLINAAEARFYVGGTIGKSSYDYVDVEEGDARNLFVGFEQDHSPLYVELAKVDTGDSDITGTGLHISIEGITFGVGFRLGSESGSAVFLKGGIYDTETTIADDFGGSARDGSSGPFIGLGGDWMLHRNFGLRFDMQGLIAVEDFADDNTVAIITVGAVAKFGGRGPAQP